MRQMNVKLGLVVGLSALAFVVAAGGCSTKTDGTDPVAAPSSAIESAPKTETKNQPQPEAGEAVGVRLERALRVLDRGGSAAEAKPELEAVLHDSSATLDEQDEAHLGLSRAREALGDKEGAISAVEELLAAHADGGRFPAREGAEKRLRLLLTGSESDIASVTAPEKFAPVAKALAAYFQPDDHGDTLVDVLAFGRNGGRLEELGGLAIPAAKRDALRQACSFCEDNLKVYQSISRTGSWVDIPRMAGEVDPTMPQIDRSLVVFYFDLESNRIPSRYDEYLPLPSADIVARLEKGQGLIAMRERKGAKPTIVIAAPRTGQLPEVEETFAKLTTLPKEPLDVSVESRLAAEEIQGIVRGSFGDIRGCYTSLLTRDPKATGSVTIKFEIGADGVVSNAATDDTKSTTHQTLADPTLTQCMVGVFSKLHFPATGKHSTVAYPIAFSPN